MAFPLVLAHLKAELARPDPWRLESNAFEQRRYDVMMSMLQDDAPFDSGLEIGCAAGAFTARLVECCGTLRVVDLLPEALARCRARLGDVQKVRYTVADTSETAGWGETYDIIVVSEVLYYLGGRSAVRTAMRNIERLMRPQGILLFGSAVDAVVRRWGLVCGAETVTEEWSRTLDIVEQSLCTGRTPTEHALLVKFRRPRT